jgi:type III secretory pathway component EscU
MLTYIGMLLACLAIYVLTAIALFYLKRLCRDGSLSDRVITTAFLVWTAPVVACMLVLLAVIDYSESRTGFGQELQNYIDD